MNNTFTLQNNALRIMSYSEFRASSGPLKIKYYVVLANCLIVHDYLKNKLPKSFENTFLKLDEVITTSTRNSTLGC